MQFCEAADIPDEPEKIVFVLDGKARDAHRNTSVEKPDGALKASLSPPLRTAVCSDIYHSHNLHALIFQSTIHDAMSVAITIPIWNVFFQLNCFQIGKTRIPELVFATRSIYDFQ
jgi:hypothetical protein